RHCHLSISLRLDAEAEDAARRGDIAGLKEAVRRIGIDAPGVDRECLAVGADVECDVVERIRREEIDRLSSRVRIRIALAVYALPAGKIGEQPARHVHDCALRVSDTAGPTS